MSKERIARRVCQNNGSNRVRVGVIYFETHQFAQGRCVQSW